MDGTKTMAADSQQAALETEAQILELNDLQLALIGGGIGNTII
jgi:hypothetical protein